MQWWQWLIIILILLWGAFSAFGKYWRVRIRREYIAYIRETHPEIEVVAEKENSVTIKVELGGEVEQVENYLGNLYNACSKPASPQERKIVYERFLQGLKNSPGKNEGLSLEIHGPNIMPRLAPRSLLDELAKVDGAPYRFFADTGLIITYVLDFPGSVIYITNKQLAELGCDEGALYELAIANLEKNFSAQAITNVLETKSISMIKSMDSHDTARVLLLPKFVPEGAQIVALIPDRDTLALVPVPADGNWDKIKRLAHIAAGRPLFNKPLLVNRNGFKIIS